MLEKIFTMRTVPKSEDGDWIVAAVKFLIIV